MSISSTELRGHVAIVTGSTSGIGQAMAKALAGQGCNVVINGLGDPHKIENERCEIANAYGVEVKYHGADMTKPDEIADMVDFAKREFGRLDILLNNAGVQHVAPIEEFPIDKWNQIIAINLSSAFHTIAAAIPLMKKAGGGRIVNIASAHGLVASPFKSAYVSAKHGIMGLTKTVALEVAREKITCNAICPGYVLTPLVEAQIPDQMKANKMDRETVIREVMLDKQPTKEFVTVEQIAAAAVFLCSDAAAQVNGTHLSVDGGWTAA